MSFVMLYSFMSPLISSSHILLGLLLILLFPCTCMFCIFLHMWYPSLPSSTRDRTISVVLRGEGCHWFNVGFSPDVLPCVNIGQLSSFLMWFLLALTLAHIIILVSVLWSFRKSYLLTAHHSHHYAIAGLI